MVAMVMVVMVMVMMMLMVVMVMMVLMVVMVMVMLMVVMVMVMLMVPTHGRNIEDGDAVDVLFEDEGSHRSQERLRFAHWLKPPWLKASPVREQYS